MQDISFLPELLELDLRDNSITRGVPNAFFLDIMWLWYDGNESTTVHVDFLAASRSQMTFSISNNSQLRCWELPNDPTRLYTLKEYINNDAQLSGTLSGFLRDSFFPTLHVLSLANNFFTGEDPDPRPPRLKQQLAHRGGGLHCQSFEA